MSKKMQLSVETYVLRERYDDETAIRMIKAAGFDAFDFSFYWADAQWEMLGENYREKAVALRKLADEVGVVCNQAHAPFAFAYADAMDMSNENYRQIVCSIEAAAILGAENIVVHCLQPCKLPEGVDLWEYNTRFYRSFLPYLEKFGICIAVENLFYGKTPVLADPEQMGEFVKGLDSDRFTVCIDVGHLQMTGFDVADVLRHSDSKKVKALHIHDNDGVSDCHWLPYCGKMPWDEVTAALGEMGYEGDLTLEIVSFLRGQDNKNLPAALKFAEQTGRLLIEKVCRHAAGRK